MLALGGLVPHVQIARGLWPQEIWRSWEFGAGDSGGVHPWPPDSSRGAFLGEGTRALSQGPCLEAEAAAEKTGEIAGEAVATMAPRQEGSQTRSPRASQAVTCPLPSARPAAAS